MSIKKALHGFFSSTALVALAIAGYSHLTHSAESKIPMFEKIARTKKLQAPATVKIRLLEEGEVEANNVYTLEATIKSEKKFSNAQWEWLVPPGVVLLDRESGTGLQIGANQVTKVTVRFRQNDGQNKRIKFVVKDSSASGVLARGAYSTTRQRAIAEENKELLERQEAYLEENPEVINTGHKAHSH